MSSPIADPKGNADVLIVADDTQLAEPMPRLRRRANPRKSGPGYRALPLGVSAKADAATPSSRFEIDPSALSLYDGNESLLVRTALIRSREWREGLKSPPQLTNSRDVARICGHLAYSSKEFVAILVADQRQRVIAIHETGIGGRSEADIDIASVLQVVLLTNGSGFILVHNHPSGKPDPSEQDVAITRALFRAARCVGVSLLDSVIVGYDGYTSFLDMGIMDTIGGDK